MENTKKSKNIKNKSKKRNSFALWWIDFFKELKRVRWPKGKTGWATFGIVLLFITIISLVLFGLAVGFSKLWGTFGVGINV